MILEHFETLICEGNIDGIRYFFLIGDPVTKKALGSVAFKNFKDGCLYDFWIYSTKKADVTEFFETNRILIKDFAGKKLSRDIIWCHTERSSFPYLARRVLKMEMKPMKTKHPSLQGKTLYYIRIPVGEE